ncbi:MAG: FtsQ-type POTRA domain-containing protein [Treponema sp.]|jgi:cell division protein FtsQ|nr:FtsQ-type POTRA domain-containing protein [Treponema sp.]
MSGDFYYGQETLETIQTPVRGRLGKGVKRLLAVTALLIGAELVWLFLIQPCMPLARIDIDGISGIAEADILSHGGIGPRTSWLEIKPEKVKQALETHWMVDSAFVEKQFPASLHIKLSKRKAVAVELSMKDGKVLPVYLDRKGVIIEMGGDHGFSSSIPIISGLLQEEPQLGHMVPARYQSVLGDVYRIGEQEPALMSAVSEIGIRKKNFDGFDLVLYPVHNPIRVLMDKELNENSLRYLLLVLDVLKEQGSAPEELDFRSGSIASYIPKGADSVE